MIKNVLKRRRECGTMRIRIFILDIESVIVCPIRKTIGIEQYKLNILSHQDNKVFNLAQTVMNKCTVIYDIISVSQ